MKKYLFIATALAALASCSDETFVGDQSLQNGSEAYHGAIVFNTGVNTVTRAEITGSDAAGLLNNNFVFAGTKGTTPTSFVFDQYTAHYTANSAHTTESNSNNWEYVSYTPASTSSLKDEDSGNPGTYIYTPQTIKYWDYGTTQYDFAAYSLGTGSATATAIAASDKTYTITGSADDLKVCYISDLVTAYNRNNVNDYGVPVQFKFRSLAAKIRLAFYETVPGYAVKDVQFYSVAENGSANTTPVLFTSSAVLPSGSGTMTITFPNTGWDKSPHGATATQSTDYNKAHVSFAQASGVDAVSTLTFDGLANFADAEKRETSTDNPATGWIGRASNAATYAGGLVDADNDNSTPETGKYFTILPYETGANLLLRIKYTLVSTDGSGETITVDNASAVVPAELATWSPNYAYTYIFKIGDMTNGSTGVDGNGNVTTGLTPITLDAVVVDSEDGVQETITTVSTPSITTYMAGKVITNNDEYVAGKNIYVIVNNGTSNVALTVGTNANLFTATVETGAAQGISEETVANCFANGIDGYDESSNATKTVTDAKGKKLVLTADDGLAAVSQIDATDSPTGNAITVNGAKFTPAAGKNYVFQYVIQAPEAAGTYTAETAEAYNATLPGAITDNTVTVYSFTSYSDDSGSTEYGTGMVKVVSTDTEHGWTTVEVISNTSTDANAANFVGHQYRVNSIILNGETYYQLYETGSETTLPIYVKVETSSPAAYNATLSGAVSAGATKPAVPGKYQYKVIKIKNS